MSFMPVFEPEARKKEPTGNLLVLAKDHEYANNYEDKAADPLNILHLGLYFLENTLCLREEGTGENEGEGEAKRIKTEQNCPCGEATRASSKRENACEDWSYAGRPAGGKGHSEEQCSTGSHRSFFEMKTLLIVQEIEEIEQKVKTKKCYHNSSNNVYPTCSSTEGSRGSAEQKAYQHKHNAKAEDKKQGLEQQAQL